MLDNQLTAGLEIIDWDGTPRVATPGNTDTGVWGTDDPAWEVSGLGNREWLQYLADDGGKWQCKIHCHFLGTIQPGQVAGLPPGDIIDFWLEHKRQDGSGGHDSGHLNQLGILFLDHRRERWGGYCQPIRRPYPARPFFLVRKNP